MGGRVVPTVCEHGRTPAKVVRGRTDKWHTVESQSWSGGIRAHCGSWFKRSESTVWVAGLIEGHADAPRCRRCFHAEAG